MTIYMSLNFFETTWKKMQIIQLYTKVSFN